MPRDQKLLIGWFGIRGIGSIYYLLYAIGQGLLQAPLTQLMMSIVLTAVAVSIVVHGISVTPLMNLYSAAPQDSQRLVAMQRYCCAWDPQSCFSRASRPQLAR